MKKIIIKKKSIRSPSHTGNSCSKEARLWRRLTIEAAMGLRSAIRLQLHNWLSILHRARSKSILSVLSRSICSSKDIKQVSSLSCTNKKFISHYFSSSSSPLTTLSILTSYLQNKNISIIGIVNNNFLSKRSLLLRQGKQRRHRAPKVRMRILTQTV